jgi:hypothetical protein
VRRQERGNKKKRGAVKAHTGRDSSRSVPMGSCRVFRISTIHRDHGTLQHFNEKLIGFLSSLWPAHHRFIDLFFLAADAIPIVLNSPRWHDKAVIRPTFGPLVALSCHNVPIP